MSLDREAFRRAMLAHPPDTLPSGTPRSSQQLFNNSCIREFVPNQSAPAAGTLGSEVILDVIAVTPQRGFSPRAAHPHHAPGSNAASAVPGQPFQPSSAALSLSSAAAHLPQQHRLATGRGAYVPMMPWSATYSQPLEESREKSRATNCNIAFDFHARRRAFAEGRQGARAALVHRSHDQLMMNKVYDGKVPVLGIPAAAAGVGPLPISADAAALYQLSSGRSCGGHQASGHHQCIRPSSLAVSPSPHSSPVISSRSSPRGVGSSNAASAITTSAATTTTASLLSSTARRGFSPPTTQLMAALIQPLGSKMALERAQEQNKSKTVLLVSHQHESLKSTALRSAARARKNAELVSHHSAVRQSMTAEVPNVVKIVEHERLVERPRRVALLQKSRAQSLSIVKGNHTGPDHVDAVIREMVMQEKLAREAREKEKHAGIQARRAEDLQKRLIRQMALVSPGESPPQQPGL